MKMVAFVMAYSFTEPDDEEDDDSDEDGDVSKMRAKKMPMMVPMADILNHVAHNNAHLDFGKESLKMVATKSIKKVRFGFLNKFCHIFNPFNNPVDQCECNILLIGKKV